MNFIIKQFARSLLNIRRKDAHLLRDVKTKVQAQLLKLRNQSYDKSRIRRVKRDGLSDFSRFNVRDIDVEATDTTTSTTGKFDKVNVRPGFSDFENYSIRNRNIGSPSISDEVWGAINRNNSSIMPKGITEVTEQAVRQADIDTIKRFTTSDNNVGYSVACLMSSAAIRVSSAFGFIDETNSGLIEREPLKLVEIGSKPTSSGWPLFTAKNKDAAKEDTVRWLNNFSRYPILSKVIINPLMYNPNFIGYRFQPKFNEATKYIDTKIRQIWLQPFRILCLEIKYFHKIINKTILLMLNSSTPLYASGLRNSEISKQVGRFRNYLKYNNFNKGRRSIYSIDYEKFDSTIHSMFSDLYFKVIGSSLNLDKRESIEFDLLRFYFKHSPFIYDKEINFQLRGVNSGSLLTNNFDTFVNCTILHMHQVICNNKRLVKFLANGGDLNVGLVRYSNSSDLINTSYPLRDDIITMGDDGLVICTNTEFRVLQQICNYFGMVVNFKHVCNKSNDPIFFLGRYWNNENEPYQTESYLVTHCVYRERYYRKNQLIDVDISEELEPIRIISICCPLVNGFEFMKKNFSNYDKLWRLIANRTKIPLLKDVFPFEGIQYFKTSDMLDWRNF